MGLLAGIMSAGWDEKGPRLYYEDNEGGQPKRNRFSVGSGSPYAYEFWIMGISMICLLKKQQSWENGRNILRWASGGFGPNGWKKLSGDDVGELYCRYNPIEPAAVEHEMTDVPVA
ncbi:unnamed protein product [Cuscuta europaea]|nr:unnamed protein product [Cuscuta europaea]